MAKVTLENGTILNVPDDATPEQIAGWVGKASGKSVAVQPQAPTDTFMGESGLSGLGALFSRMTSDPSGSPAAGLVKAVPDILKGIWGETKSEIGKVPGAISDPNDSAFKHLVGAVPLVGHGLSHLGTNITEGNYGGAAGDLLSVFGPKLSEAALGKAASMGEDAGFEMYHKGLRFDPTQNSVEDIKGAVRTGIKEGLPVPKINTPESQSSLTRIGDVSTPGTLLGDLEQKITPYVTGANGARPLDAEKVLGPYLQKIQGILKAPVAGAPRMASTMLAEIKPVIREMDPALHDIIYDPNGVAPGVPFSPGQQARLLEGWAKNNQTLTVARGHEASRAINSLISDSAYKDVNPNVVPGETSANLLLRKGLKDGVNDVSPQVAQINNKMHDLITLKTAMNQAAKGGGTAYDQLIRTLMGGMEMAGAGAGVAALAGHHGSIPLGLGGTGALVLSKLLGSPRTASQMGIGLGRNVPAIAGALQGPGQALAQAGRGLPKTPSGDDEIEKLFNSILQK